MLVQLHKQNRDTLQSEFLAQIEIDVKQPENREVLMDWTIKMIHQYKDEFDGLWVPMICEQGSEYFVMQNEA